MCHPEGFTVGVGTCVSTGNLNIEEWDLVLSDRFTVVYISPCKTTLSPTSFVFPLNLLSVTILSFLKIYDLNYKSLSVDFYDVDITFFSFEIFFFSLWWWSH